MADVRLPERGDSVIFITPPTIAVDTRLFLYSHDLYTRKLHTRRLLGWLESRGVSVHYIDSLGDPQSRPVGIGTRTAGPNSARPASISAYAFGLDEETLRRRLTDAGRPSQVWITTFYAYDRELLRATIAIVRSVYPGVPVVVGGAYASLCPDLCLGLGADRVHQGLVAESESHLAVQEGRYGFVLAGRGCPNRCAYCAFHRIEGAKPVSYAEDRILGEVDRLIESGVTLLALYAPSVFRGALAEPTERIMERLAERDITTMIWAGFEPLTITPRRAELARRAGVFEPSIPLQAHDRRTTREWGRRETLQDFLDTVQVMRDAGYSGLEISSDIIVGHPGSPLEETIRSACFLWSQGVTPLQFPYTCVPGSADALSLGIDFSSAQVETLQSYLWPHARRENTANDYIQFSTLCRVLPQLVEIAVATLDPESAVPKLVERYLNEFGFSIPQWKPKTALPKIRRSYQQHLSHAWEFVLALVENGGVEEAASYVELSEQVSVCEPRYLEIPRAFFDAGLYDAAISTLRGAARCLPRPARVALSGDHVLDQATEEPRIRLIRGIVADGLREMGRETDAERWRSRAGPGAPP
jgi:hypothetical protein